MGKSTAAAYLEKQGLAVFHADAVVHRVLEEPGPAKKRVTQLFPEVTCKGRIDRGLLGNIVFASPLKLRRLEKILHPAVLRKAKAFLKEKQHSNKQLVVLEIPLLFELGANRFCDVVLCLTAPRSVQTKRVLRRRGMTRSKLQAIRRQQMPDKEKQRLADIVLNTAQSAGKTERQLKQLVKSLLTEKTHA